MDKKETIKNIINNSDGIAKTADFVAGGLTNYDVANLCKEGYLERIRHGYYRLAEQEDIKEEQVPASLLPESIVCVESALFYYGYSDFSSRQWSPYLLTDKAAYRFIGGKGVFYTACLV